MKNYIYVFFSMIIAFSIFSSFSSAYNYELEFFDAGTQSANSQTNPPSWRFNDATRINFNETLYTSLNGTSFPISYSASFYNPFSTIFKTAGGSLSSVKSCNYAGRADKSISSVILDHRIMASGGNSSSFIFSKTKLEAESSKRYFFIEGNYTDSEGYMSNAYMIDSICTPPISSLGIAQLFNSENYTLCAKNTFSYAYGTSGFIQRDNYQTGGVSCGGGNSFSGIYYIFNSTNGNVTYSFITGNAGETWRVVYYEFDNPSGVTTITTGAQSGSGELSLNKNKLYVIAGGKMMASGAPYYWLKINLTIDLGISNYICGEFSECVDNYKQRICIDENGLNPDRIETLACSLTTIPPANLGFEDYQTITDVATCAPTWFLGCGWQNINISVDRPTGWTEYGEGIYGIDFHNNFMKMTSEWATEGTRSLKMWNIPAMEGIPLDYSNTCYNTTSSLGLTGINKTITNTSIASVYNISFPSDLMHFSFTARACIGNELHNDNLETIFGIELCPKMYYANNGSIDPTSNFMFDIVDDGYSVFGTPYYLSAPSVTWKQITGAVNYVQPYALSQTFEFDLSGLGIEAGKSYMIIFAPHKNNVLDRSGNCIMIDEVKYWQDEENFESITGCESKCVGRDYYTATRNSEGKCSTVKTANYAECFENEEIRNSIADLEDYCDGTTRYYFDSKTSQFLVSSNNSICIAEEEAKQANEDLYNLGTINFFSDIAMSLLSPIFISFIIIISIMVMVQMSTNEWRLSVFVGFGIMLLLTIAGFFDPLITISLLILIIFFASLGVGGTVLGKNNRGG